MSLITKRWGLKCRIKKIFYKIYYKKEIYIHRTVTFRDDFKILPTNNSNIIIKEETFFNNGCSISCQGKISIGRNCLFGEGVKIYDHNHIFKNIPELIVNQGFKVGEVFIGNNCWIGSNVVILKGANIGDNCVISAGCIIDYNVPSGNIVKRDGSFEEIRIKNG